MRSHLALGVAAFAVGLLVGYVRPVRRLVDWNWDRTIYGLRGRTTAADVVLFFVLHPWKSYTALRHPKSKPQGIPGEAGPRWRKPITQDEEPCTQDQEP